MNVKPSQTVLSHVRARLGVAGLLVTVALAPGAAAAQSAETIVRGWLEAMRAGGASVDAGSITYAGGSDLLAVRDLKIALPGIDGKAAGTIRLPAIDFVGLTRPGGSGLSARSMTVASVEGSADDGSWSMSMAGLEGRNIALPDFSIYRSDPTRPFSSQIQLLKILTGLRADSHKVGKVQITFRIPTVTGTSDFQFTYEGMTSTGVAGGRVERFESGPITAKGTTTNNGTVVPFELRVGSAEIVGYDIGAYLKVLDPDSYLNGRGDGVWRDIQKSARIDGISFSTGPAQFSIARFAMGAIRMRQADVPFAADYDRMLDDPKAFEAEVAKNPKAALRFVFSVARTMAIESYSLDDWNLAGPDLDRFRLGRFLVRDLSPDGLGEVSIDGVDVSATGNLVKFARFAFGGVKFPAYEAIERAFDAATTGAEVDPTSVIPTLGFVRFEGAEVTAAGKGTMSLGSFAIDLGQYVKAIPTSIRIALKNLAVPASVAEDPKAREVFSTMGYATLDVSADIALRWNEATSDLTIETLGAGLAEGGAVALNGVVGNVPRALIERPERAEQFLPGLTLKSVGLAYRDASLIERFLKVVGAQSRLTPATLRETAIAALPQVLKDVRDPAQQQAMIQALTTFLREPRTLQVASQLRAPLPVLQLVGTVASAPQQLPNLLQLEIAANR